MHCCTSSARADKNIVNSAQPDGLDCPDCAKRLSWAQIRFGETLRCPRCGSRLVVPRSYRLWLGRFCLVLTGLLAYGFGARGWILAAAVPIGFFPVVMVSSTIARRVLPPTLIFSCGFRKF